MKILYDWLAANNTLPKDPTSEAIIIGQVLVEGSITSHAVSLSTTDFTDPIHRAVWGAILEVDVDGREIEPISVFEIAKRDNPQSIQSISQITQYVAESGIVNIHNAVEAVLEKSKRRFVINSLAREIGRTATGTRLEDVTDSLATLRSKVPTSSINRGFISLKQITEEQVQPGLKRLSEGKSDKVKTGFPDIDKFITGLTLGEDVLLVAADPKAGKSALVLQMGTQIAQQGIGVAYLSGEMRNRENAYRVISQQSHYLNINSIDHLNPDEYDYLSTWADHLKDLPIYFDDITFDLETVEANVRAAVDEFGVKVLIIDYIQLFKLTKNWNPSSRSEKIAELSMAIKRLGKTLGLAVIMVAQFNREGQKSAVKAMHGLDGSSQLEKDASIMIFIETDPEVPGIADLRVIARNAGKEEIKGHFRGEWLHFNFGQEDYIDRQRRESLGV